jgi:hypothetical protein
VWATPVVQSLRVPAFAQAGGPGSGLCDACIAATVSGVTTHQVYNASVACCDCLAANGNGLAGLITCVLVTGACQPLGPVQPGACP